MTIGDYDQIFVCSVPHRHPAADTAATTTSLPCSEWVNDSGRAVLMFVGEIFGVNGFCAEFVCSGDDGAVPIRNTILLFQRERLEHKIGIDSDDRETG